ncbi:uncharacterized protein [Centruroides vittatus]|uniref:uncharacterized protein n=1 Tax=Centruroides vittatus TaxID=120091 RepID=UPI0035106FA4
MKVIYRSVSKIRRQGSFLSWITSSSVHAVATFTKFAKSTGVTSLLKIIISLTLISVIIPILAASFLLFTTYKYTVQELLSWLYPEDELKIIWSVPVRSVFDWQNDKGFATFLAIVDGSPDIKKIKKLTVEMIDNLNHFSYIKRTIGTKFGCYVWKKLDNEFNIDNQILLSTGKWKGKSLNEDLLQNYLNELYMYGLPTKNPPWQIIIVPLSENASYAIIIRHHYILSTYFNEFIKQLFCKEQINLQTIHPTSSTIFATQIALAFLTLLDLVHHFIEVPIYFLKELMTSKIQYHKQRISGKKSISWTENLNLEFVNKIAEQSLVKPKDVLLFGIAGALRRYYSVMEGYIPDYLFSMVMHKSDMNKFDVCEFSPVMLPLATLDIKCRLLKLITQSKSLKNTQLTSRITSVLLNYVNRLLPQFLVDSFVESVTKKYSLIVNDMHVLSCVKTLWNDDVRMIHYWKMPIKHIGVSLSLMYMPQYVSLSAITDSSSMQRPDLLMAYFMREINDFAIHLKIRTERRHSPVSEIYSRRNYLYHDNL